MKRGHALLISLVVGTAAIFGTLAATKTVRLGRPAAAQPAAASTVIAKRTQQLDRAEIALRKALRQKPPKLPPLPATMPARPSGGGSPAASAAPTQQRVVYVRPAPIIRHLHRAGGEREGEGDHEASAHAGGGFDD
jgi:hypothetical protein